MQEAGRRESTPSVEVVVPWRPGCRHRERAWAWVNGRYAVYHPDWPVTVARAPAGNWIKANAVVPAVEASSAEVVIVADADVWVDDLARAVESVERGSAWAVPHWQVRRLTEKATDDLIGGADLLGLETCEPPYHPTFGGGIVVARRDVLLDCPLDPRFVGWGQEDAAWGVALHALAGPAWAGRGLLTHLWHPPQPRATRKVGSVEGRQLFRRYVAARKNPAHMRALIEEARHGDS